MDDPTTTRLRKIIARLEAKMQPLHDENEQLKAKLEDLQLDHDLALEQAKAAELELASYQENPRQSIELSSQVEALETLKRLSDELEKDQREEILRLEDQLAQAKQDLAQATSELTYMKSERVNDPEDLFKQQLALLKHELEAAKLELAASKSSILDTLREYVDFDLPKTRYMVALHGDEGAVRSIFDSFKSGTLGTKDLQRELHELLQSLNASAATSPKFNPEHARKYLFEVSNDSRMLNLSDQAAAKVLEDPTRIEDLETESVDTTLAKELEPVQETSSEIEHLQLKVSILSEKAALAAKFAAELEKAKENASATEVQQQQLQSHIDELKSQLSAQRDEIYSLEAAQTPDLSTITYRQTLSLLSDTIQLLHKRSEPLILEPIKYGAARNLSALAGGSLVNQIWDAIDTIEKPKNKMQWAVQMRKLSLIDA